MGVGMVLLSVYIYSKPTVKGKVEVGNGNVKRVENEDPSGIAIPIFPGLQRGHQE
jgi:hypothetical protein